MKRRMDKRCSMQEFCTIWQVEYWRKQLNESNINNLTKKHCTGTRKCYTYGLYGFNQWVTDKTITHKKLIQINSTTYKNKEIVDKISNVGHFLELYQQATNKHEFIILIKQYLLWLQSCKGHSTVDNALYAIKSFFRENDLDIAFRFNNKKCIPLNESLMTLEELKKIITMKSIQKIEKAVFLCKFHRGLDSSTFADQFNFEVWGQLINYFGTDIPNEWDLDKCPVPIKLIRVKTNYLHTGFLDRDAIKSIQDYLKVRTDKTSRSRMTALGHSKIMLHTCGLESRRTALFLDNCGNPISINWIQRRFHKLYNNSRSATNLTNQKIKCASHELRDLLKSTLIDSGCRLDVADHVIGHSPKDSYEKQAILYPDSLRDEFAKCSARINFLPDIAHSSQKSDDIFICEKAQNRCTEIAHG